MKRKAPPNGVKINKPNQSLVDIDDNMLEEGTANPNNDGANTDVETGETDRSIVPGSIEEAEETFLEMLGNSSEGGWLFLCTLWEPGCRNQFYLITTKALNERAKE